MQLPDLITKSQSLLRKKEPILIGIDGRGGSGKSTLAQKIIESFRDTSIIHLDDFRSKEVYEVDRRRLINDALTPLKHGETARYKKWLWGEEKFTDYVEMLPQGVILIEGVTALHPELRDYYDFTIWVDCEPKIAFERGLNRDRTEYQVDTESSWINEWIPYENEYISKYDPKSKADCVFNSSELSSPSKLIT